MVSVRASMHKVQFSLYTDFYFKGVNVGFKIELLTAHHEFTQEKALQGENTTGGLSYFTVSFQLLL